MSGWQPIKTVPEGRHVLLWFPKGERGNGGMEAATVFWEDGRIKGGWTHGGPNSGSDWDFREDPTMWRHLPDIPSQDEAP